MSKGSVQIGKNVLNLENLNRPIDEIKEFVKNDEILGKMDDSAISEFVDQMKNLSPEDIEKYMEYQKSLLSMGLPCCRMMMISLLKHSKSDNIELKMEFSNIIENETTVEKVGGMNITYMDKKTNKETYFYIIMNKCDSNHDMAKQFDKIQSNFQENEWREILKSVSTLIYICQNIYKLTISSCSDHIFNLGFDINDVETLKLDDTNLTLYIDESWEERVGVYIMRECDLEEERLEVEKEMTKVATTETELATTETEVATTETELATTETEVATTETKLATTETELATTETELATTETEVATTETELATTETELATTETEVTTTETEVATTEVTELATTEVTELATNN